MNFGQDAASRSKTTGWAFLMMFLGIGIGWGMYRTFSPGERARRIRVSDARDHARKVRDACRQELNPFLDNSPMVTTSVNTPMQCMLKGVCSQCLQWLIDQNSDPESDYYMTVDTSNIGIAGQSQGGGAALAAGDGVLTDGEGFAQIKSVVAMNPFGPSWVDAQSQPKPLLAALAQIRRAHLQ